MFLDTLHRPLAPHSICASCLPLTGLQYESTGMDSGSQYELQPKPAYCTASKQKKSKLVLQLFYTFTTALYCFLQLKTYFILTVAILNAHSVRAVLKGPHMAIWCPTAGL